MPLSLTLAVEEAIRTKHINMRITYNYDAAGLGRPSDTVARTKAVMGNDNRNYLAHYSKREEERRGGE